MPASRPLPERFWEKVNKGGPIHPTLGTACWVWRAGSGQGYGRIDKLRAHRVSWELHNGPVPDELFVLHQCDVRTCVNPAHLYLGTLSENMQDCVRRGRNSNRLKTHCPKGHAYAGSNLGVSPSGSRKGGRYCKACVSANSARSHRKTGRGTTHYRKMRRAFQEREP